MGLQITTVLRLHSLGAAASGLTACVYPGFFGAVFPSLSTDETLQVISQIYSILVLAQAFLLVGIREIDSIACLRKVAGIYCLVFSFTSLVAWQAASMQLTSGLGNQFYLVWLSMALPYAYLSAAGTRVSIHQFTKLHGAVAAAAGLGGLLLSRTLNHMLYLTPRAQNKTGNYDTVSRYYGILICGMSLLTHCLVSKDAAAAYPAARRAFAAMFAGSALALCTAIWKGFAKFGTGEFLPDLASSSSIVMFLGLSILYSTARVERSVKVDKTSLVQPP